eukprot:5641896-Amphidinium_carterae.1
MINKRGFSQDLRVRNAVQEGIFDCQPEGHGGASFLGNAGPNEWVVDHAVLMMGYGKQEEPTCKPLKC